ncbi:DUF2271 domain-containing protein [Lentilitoribacter sp. Alg239-R112]|uniref:DUF2271 domain-containing protein n=1 Tax=Lentilitoribacter sp. Alg239-R112 TaxID=2305987 RepID=UPI0013A6BFC8|nr:DUF2271 domain-containing protein [Lentilitoribacter sp. Alg239-R112]
MRKIITALALSTALMAPSLAYAKTISATVTMKGFRGPPAYVAVYLTKPNGQFHSTLSIKGSKNKYRKHLRGWIRGSSRSKQKLDGLSGASVGSGRTFTVSANVKDALLSAGYQVHVDTAVEDRGEFKSDAAVVMNSTQSSAVANGKGFVKSVKVQWN